MKTLYLDCHSEMRLDRMGTQTLLGSLRPHPSLVQAGLTRMHQQAEPIRADCCNGLNHTVLEMRGIECST